MQQYINDIIDVFIPGDWGNDSFSKETPYAVRCIRGADIENVNKNIDNNIPYRYISKSSLKNRILEVGDIIVEKSGGSPTQSTGRTAYLSKELLENIGDTVCSNFCVGIRLKPGINPRYISYYLELVYKSGVFFNFEGKTTGIKNLLLDTAFSSIPIPPINTIEQKNVINILTCIDNKIVLNNRINAELEEMAKALYDYWFVQFDFPAKNGETYKSSGGKMIWNEELKREIPEGWKANKIRDILYTSLGGTPSTTIKEYWEEGTISWLNSGEIANFPIICSELKITEAAVKKSATEFLPKGSVMLSITRHLRPSVLAIDACANQSVVGIKEKGDIRYFYLYPYLKNEVPRLNAMRSGAQQPHINKDIIDESFIVLPSESSNILKKYNSIVGPLYERIINNAFQNQQLAGLRDWLLPMLMNGQVKVN